MEATKTGMEKLGITALVSMGGDGSLNIAQQMHEAGIPIVGVPLAEATGRLRTVPLVDGFVHATRSLGICLGD